ncbi:MAG: SUMF1/EgtB/PvdO family nonheme iron enzyme [Anaerolineae bacterium]|nr:SUMF1/EgtB/PvdO family nonheme iron enzyme [Anaerolineae bacterium]
MTDEQLIEQLQLALADLKASDDSAIPRLTQTLKSLGVDFGNGAKTAREIRRATGISNSIQTIIRRGGLPDPVISTLTEIHHTLRMINRQALLNYNGPRRHIRVFISSPGDVAEERGIAMTIINRLNVNPSINARLEIETIAWDRSEACLSIADHLTPHEDINRKVLPSECDLVVVLFWTQMGIPLDAEWVKPESFRYLHGTEWEARYLSATEYQWVQATQAANTSGNPVVLTYRRTEKALLDPDAPDFEAAAEQHRRVNAFFDSLSEPDKPARGHYYPYEKPADFEYLFEEHLLQEIKTLLDKPAQPGPAPKGSTPAWPAVCSPFPGLRPFEPQDALIFFGRGTETDALVRRLTRDRFVAVVAPPGAGKSSLIQAGLIPRLESGAVPGVTCWRVVMLKLDETQDGNPFRVLAACLQPGMSSQDEEVFSSQLQADPEIVSVSLCQDLLAGEPEGTEILLFVDQFENLFITVDEPYREPFVRALAVLAEFSKARVVLALSTDFHDSCMKLAPLKPLLETGTYPLYAPERSRLHEMITGPADMAGLSYEEGLVRRILEDAGDAPDALSLMAYALELLWRLCILSHPAMEEMNGLLTHAAYDSFDGVQGALTSQTQTAYLALPLDEAARRAAFWRVFAQLVTVYHHEDSIGGCTATRRRVSLEAVRGVDGSQEAWLVDALIEARLLTTSYDPITGQTLLAVAHEALFWNWEPLRTWIDEMGEEIKLINAFKQARLEWEANDCRPDLLWQPDRVQQLLSVIDSHPALEDLLEPADWDFLRPEPERLLEELHTDINHARRSEIGLRLHIINDGRPGVGLVGSQSSQGNIASRERRMWGTRPEHEDLPDIVWMAVKGTDSYRLETSEGDRGIYSITNFYLAKYPITYQQYRVFLDADDGFQNPRWWEGLAADDDNKSKPGEQRFKYNNHPAENVSWYDAIAFCRWLNARLGLPDIPINMQVGLSKGGWFGLGAGSTALQDYPGIRLPTEWEWQWAATGGNPDYRYPWGPEWDDAKTNTSESGLNRTTAVGIYPANVAPCGALDMSGNVWEWCLNEYDSPQNISLGGSDGRVVRGGSWGSHRDHARTVCRLKLGPLDRSNSDGGFRVCMSYPPR